MFESLARLGQLLPVQEASSTMFIILELSFKLAIQGVRESPKLVVLSSQPVDQVRAAVSEI